MMLNGMGIPFGALIPIFIFFSIASSMGKQKQSKRKRGYVRESTRKRRTTRRDYRRNPKLNTKPLVTRNPFKKTGVEKFKDFDYKGSIEDFKKALQIENRDTAVHFNLACAYSLTEEKDLAFQHLSNAVSLGFKDFEKIKSHDALAFLRVQDEFDEFVVKNYKWPLSGVKQNKKSIIERPDVLQQLNQLSELKQKGLLTQAEFEAEKRKLMR